MILNMALMWAKIAESTLSVGTWRAPFWTYDNVQAIKEYSLPHTQSNKVKPSMERYPSPYKYFLCFIEVHASGGSGGKTATSRATSSPRGFD